MAKKINKLILGASGKLDMPLEEVAGLPVMRLRGFHEMLVENHSGIREYGEDKIVIGTKIGTVCLRGDELTVTSMNEREMTVVGRIISVELDPS